MAPQCGSASWDSSAPAQAPEQSDRSRPKVTQPLKPACAASCLLAFVKWTSAPRRSLLFSRNPHHKSLEIIRDFDLTTEAAVARHFTGRLDHLALHIASLTYFGHPRFVHE